MKRAGEQKIYVQSTNTHLLNILEDDYYMELGVVNMSTISKLLDNQVLELSQLIYYEILNSGIGQITGNATSDIYYQLNYLLSLRQKSSSNKIFLTCGTIIHYDELNNERYAPVVLIPIEIDYKNGRVTCSGQPVVNRLLIKLLSSTCRKEKDEQNKFYEYYTTMPLNNIGDIDKVMIDLANECHNGYSPSNYLTVCKVEYSDFVINNNFFNIERSLYETNNEEIIKTYFKNINAILPTNIEQKYAIIKASMGDSFAVDGRLGSGKTYTILNIIADFISKGKHILYVNQDLDNIWDLEKNLRYLDLNHHLYNLTKSLRDVTLPVMDLPKLSNTEFTDEDLENITKFENGLDEKINGYSIRTLLESLAVLRNSNQLLTPIEIETNLQKYEIDDLYNDLKKVEEAIKEVGIYDDNIWKKLHTSHNNITENEIIERAKNLNNIHKVFVSSIKSFCNKYKLSLPRSINDTYRLISHIVSFNTTKPLATWKNKQTKIDAINSLSEIQQLSDNNYSALNYYNEFISDDYEPGRAKQILKELCGKYLKIKVNAPSEDVVYLDKLLLNGNTIQSYIDQIDLVITKINESEKMLDLIFESKDFHKNIDQSTYNFLINYCNFLSNNFILSSWIDKAINKLNQYTFEAEKVKKAYNKAKLIRDNFKKYLINENDLTYEIIQETFKNPNYNKLFKRAFDLSKVKKAKANLSDLIIDVKDYYGTILPVVCFVKDENYSGTIVLEKQIESYINLFDLISSFKNNQFELFRKSLKISENQVYLNLDHVYSVLKKFKEESLKIEEISNILVDYNIAINGENAYDKKSDLQLAKNYLSKTLTSKLELLKTFKNRNSVNYEVLSELINNDELYLSTKKTMETNSTKYKELLGINYKGFDTILSPIRQTLEIIDDFIVRLDDDANIEQLFEEKTLSNFISDCDKLTEKYNEWIALFRTFSLCFKGGKNVLQESSIVDTTKLLEKYNSTLNHIEYILFINETIKKCDKLKLNALIKVIESSTTEDNIANSYLLSSLNKIYNMIVKNKPYLLDFANYENTVEKYINYEIDLCTKTINKLQQKSEKKIKGNIQNVRFNDYNKIVEMHYKQNHLFIADLNIFNGDFNLEPFDLVIIDDGHLSSSNKYTRIVECNQCIVFGDKTFSRSIVNTLMQRINDGAIISYRNRYIRMSSKFNNIWSNNNRYIYSFDIKIQKQKLNSIKHFALTVVDFFERNKTHIINVVVGNENSRREIYSNIVSVLETIYSSSEITEILCYNIRIINALDEGSRYVHDVMVYYDDFVNMEKNQKELIFKNFVVVSDHIFIYYVGSRIEEDNNAILKDINATIGKSNNNIKKTTGISRLLFEKLKEKNIKAREGFGYFDIIIEENNTVGVMVIGKATSEDFSLLDEYKYYYREYQRNKWIVEVIYVGDLINHFDDTVDELIKLSKETK